MITWPGTSLQGIRDRGGALVAAGEAGAGKPALLMAPAEMASATTGAAVPGLFLIASKPTVNEAVT
jgi:hypothetical protein